jgi:hypothetical protein
MLRGLDVPADGEGEKETIGGSRGRREEPKEGRGMG